MALYSHSYPAISIDPFPDYAKETKQDTGNASLASIDGKLGSLGQKAMSGSAPVVIASDQSAIPASQSGTWNINNISGSVALPTGAATEANQTTELTRIGDLTETAPATDTASSGLNGRLQRLAQRITSLIALLPGSLGQKTAANSLAVTVASDQSAIPASQSGTWNINNVSGTVSLPTGAATETTLSSVNGKLGSLGQKAMAGSAPVVIASDQSAVPASQSGTWNINNVSGTVTLPTGAATETTLSNVNGKLGSLGQKVMTGSAPVVIASDQSAVPSSQSGTWTVQPGNTANTTAWRVISEGSQNGTFAQSTSLGTTAATASAPSNAAGFILFADSGNSANIRFCMGAVASTTNGIPLEPGRDTGFIPGGVNVSVCATSGTQTYYIQWINR